MNLSREKLVSLGIAVATVFIGQAAWSQSEWRYSAVQRTVAVADIHGATDK
ncbi:MAG: hypothetical protein ACJ0SL_06235 [Candidatus Rariloculaceae bacterium]